jgi:hypothetical protein
MHKNNNNQSSSLQKKKWIQEKGKSSIVHLLEASFFAFMLYPIIFTIPLYCNAFHLFHTARARNKNTKNYRNEDIEENLSLFFFKFIIYSREKEICSPFHVRSRCKKFADFRLQNQNVHAAHKHLKIIISFFRFHSARDKVFVCRMMLWWRSFTLFCWWSSKASI